MDSGDVAQYTLIEDDDTKSTSTESYRGSTIYRLAGVVVHSGVASAGHYYSFVRKRNPSENGKAQWYKFNDEQVGPVTLGEKEFNEEFFGGKYKSNGFAGWHDRFWSAFMLFYEREDANINKLVESPPKKENSQFASADPVFSTESSCGIEDAGRKSSNAESDSSQGSVDNLAVRLHQLDLSASEMGVFKENMPASIERRVDQANLEFMNLRDIMNDEYTYFLLHLLDLQTGPVDEDRAVTALELGTNYLLNVNLHCHKSFRHMAEDIETKIKSLFVASRLCCEWFIKSISIHQRWLSEYFLECPLVDVRIAFAQLVAESLISYFEHNQKDEDLRVPDIVGKLLESLVSLFDTIKTSQSSAKDHPERLSQLFSVLEIYLGIGVAQRNHMLEINFFEKTYNFLIGDPKAIAEENFSRAWSRGDAKAFRNAHSALATLLCGCDMSVFQDEGCKRPNIFQEKEELLPMPSLVKSLLIDNSRYIIEIISFLEMYPPTLVRLMQSMSWENSVFTKLLMVDVKTCLSRDDFKTNELFRVIEALAKIPDSLQEKRNNMVLTALLDLIFQFKDSQGPKAYRFFKFAIRLQNLSPFGRQFFRQRRNDWKK
eukprot:UC4_evm1s1145